MKVNKAQPSRVPGEGSQATSELKAALAAMNAQPDVSGNDSERLREFCHISSVEIKAVGMVSAATSLEMIGYIRELEWKLTQRLSASGVCNGPKRGLDSPASNPKSSSADASREVAKEIIDNFWIYADDNGTAYEIPEPEIESRLTAIIEPYIAGEGERLAQLEYTRMERDAAMQRIREIKKEVWDEAIAIVKQHRHAFGRSIIPEFEAARDRSRPESSEGSQIDRALASIPVDENLEDKNSV